MQKRTQFRVFSITAILAVAGCDGASMSGSGRTQQGANALPTGSPPPGAPSPSSVPSASPGAAAATRYVYLLENTRVLYPVGTSASRCDENATEPDAYSFSHLFDSRIKPNVPKLTAAGLKVVEHQSMVDDGLLGPASLLCEPSATIKQSLIRSQKICGTTNNFTSAEFYNYSICGFTFDLVQFSVPGNAKGVVNDMRLFDTIAAHPNDQHHIVIITRTASRLSSDQFLGLLKSRPNIKISFVYTKSAACQTSVKPPANDVTNTESHAALYGAGSDDYEKIAAATHGKTYNICDADWPLWADLVAP